MSVQLNHYLILGIKLSFQEHKQSYDKLEPYMDSPHGGIKHHKGLSVLYDGMTGKYILVGRVIAKGGNHAGFDKPIEINELVDDDQQTRELIAGAIEGQLNITCQAEDVGYIVVTHYR